MNLLCGVHDNLNHKTTVAVIGSAGRNEDSAKMSKDIFDSMLRNTLSIIKIDFGLNLADVILVSGGSAWSDHVAVRLWLDAVVSMDIEQFAGLTLYVPCDIGDDHCFVSNHSGSILNDLHSRFSAKTGLQSITDIICCKALGAVVNSDFKSFHKRNLQVAKSDYMIAYTWGSTNVPKPGGTKDTWDHCKSKHKVHVPLSTLSNVNNKCT